MSVGVLIGGGRQNVIRGNTFVNCTTPLYVDGRGLATECDTTSDPTKNPTKVIGELEQGFHYRQPPLSLAFPAINVTLAPCAPALNTIADNQLYHPEKSTSQAAQRDCARHVSSGTQALNINLYTTQYFGSYCCSVPAVGLVCKASIWCLTPGREKKTSFGSHRCEGLSRCGNNPKNETACKPPPARVPWMPSGFADFNALEVKPEWHNDFRNNTAGCKQTTG